MGGGGGGGGGGEMFGEEYYELGRVVSRFGISVWYRLVLSQYFPNRYRRKTLEVCPYGFVPRGNRDPYVGILVPTRDPLP